MADPSSPLYEELVRVSADLDVLLADMQVGQPSQTRSDGHIDQVEQLAARMRKAARGPGRTVNPPLSRVDGGYLW